MAKTALEVLNDELTAQIAAAKDHLGNASAKSYEDYKETCGLIRGLGFALRAVKDLSRHEEFEND